MDTNAPVPDASSGTTPPEKHVRTFASDMEAFKKGGTPTPAPVPVAPAPQTRPVAPPAPVPAPATPPSTLGQAPRPAPAPVVPPVYAPPLPGNAPLKTYSGDFTERMQDMHATTATVLAAEQDSAPIVVESSQQEAVPNRHTALYLIAGAVLLVAGIAGAAVAYLRYQTAIAPVIPAPTASAPIFVDDREQIAGSGQTLLVAVETSVARPLASGTVRLLYTADAGVTSVFAALPLSAPGALVRNTIVERSMTGVVSVNGAQTPFFILAVSSYSSTFGSMLSWERTMSRDLSSLFPSYSAVPSVTVPPAVAATSSPAGTKATSTPQATVPVAAAGFVDAVVANHDVRVYRDAAGRDVVLYGYWNQTTLVIARDAAAFAEILGRLASSRAQN